MLDTATGEMSRARLAPADRAGVRRFAGRFRGQQLEVALEATGWRFVVEELQAIGAEVHLAEPAETAARRGTKKRAKSDRADARHLRELLMVGRLPESWIGPEHPLDLCARVRLRHTVVDARREWQQRMQAVLYHHGVPSRSWLMTAGDDRRARHATDPARRAVARLRAPPARLPGADAPLLHRTADVDHDPRRARRRAPLPVLRWALFEAAECARRTNSPDHDYYQQAAERLGGNCACLAVARKLLKRGYHTLRELGEEALTPA